VRDESWLAWWIRGLSASTLQPLTILTGDANFPRNEAPNPAEYLGERPEMTSHGGEPKKAKNNKT